MLDLNTIFDPRVSQELSKLPVLPFGQVTPAGTYSLPNNLTWNDVDSFKVYWTANNIPTQSQDVEEVDSEFLRLDSWSFSLGLHQSGNIYGANVARVSDTQFSISNAGVGTVYITGALVKFKKYATINLTRTIDVIPANVTSGNFVNGNEITVNQRYEIPASTLPSEMINDDGTIKNSLTIIPKVNASGSAYNGFLDAQSESVICGVAGDKLLVATGTKLVDSSKLNLWGVASDVTSATCELVVILSGETYITQVAGSNP